MPWPQPNAHGVYDKAQALRFVAGHERHYLALYLLEIEAGWIAAVDYRLASDRWISPLNAGPGHYPWQRPHDCASDAVFGHLDGEARNLNIPARLVTGVKRAYQRHAQLDLFA